VGALGIEEGASLGPPPSEAAEGCAFSLRGAFSRPEAASVFSLFTREGREGRDSATGSFASLRSLGSRASLASLDLSADLSTALLRLFFLATSPVLLSSDNWILLDEMGRLRNEH
jgi:hypothetical protein